MSAFRVYWRGEYPKKKRVYYDGEFAKRQQARQWCRNHGVGKDGLTIVHPDGKEERCGREARIASRIAMEITKGLDGLECSWQLSFPPTTECCRCGGEARIGFVTHEGIVPEDDNDPYPIWKMRDNGGPGDLWPHDSVAVAVYFCRDCLETKALYNQA